MSKMLFERTCEIVQLFDWKLCAIRKFSIRSFQWFPFRGTCTAGIIITSTYSFEIFDMVWLEVNLVALVYNYSL